MEWTTGGNPAAKVKGEPSSHGQFCLHCGAWRGSLGLEPTIELFVEHIVEIFREVRRVLRPDGCVFCNLGDSYSGGGRAGKDGIQKWGGLESNNQNRKYGPPVSSPGLKPKDLCGVPWRVALALQEDGWYLRSDIIWSKPNPMPESVTDRPTRAHEYIFLFSKSAKYFWDAMAVREVALYGEEHARKATSWGTNRKHPNKNNVEKYAFKGDNHTCSKMEDGSHGRNLRSVWTIATAPFPEAHFATFPPKLVETCIKAGTSEHGVCPKCGAPWVRVVEKKNMVINRSHNHPPELRTRTSGTMVSPAETKTLGWRPSCRCADHQPVPATVCDIFGGAGTTGLVAAKMGRNAILIEIKPDYCDMAAKRIKGELGMMVNLCST